jgi:hypothetical protein
LQHRVKSCVSEGSRQYYKLRPAANIWVVFQGAKFRSLIGPRLNGSRLAPLGLALFTGKAKSKRRALTWYALKRNIAAEPARQD